MFVLLLNIISNNNKTKSLSVNLSVFVQTHALTGRPTETKFGIEIPQVLSMKTLKRFVSKKDLDFLKLKF